MGYIDYYRLSTEEKLQVLQEVSDRKGLPMHAVEKDWWVVRTLEILFNSSIKDYLVFKGGTSLSKAWGLIQRFSEDIDLAINPTFFDFSHESPSRTQVTKLRKQSKTHTWDTLLPELKEMLFNAQMGEVKIQIRETTESDQDPVIIEVHYPSVTEAATYVLPRVLIEIGCRSLREPFTHRVFQSLIAEEFSDSFFSDDPIKIPSVNPERTFLEKLFLLHEEFQRPKDRMRFERLSRHLYDIYQISKTKYADKAITDKVLYQAIVKHRSVFSKLGGVDYKSHFPPTLNPIPPNDLMKEWEQDYGTMQKEMIYGESPSFQKLITTVQQVADRINQISV